MRPTIPSGTSAPSAAVAESPTETLSVVINGAPVEGAAITATVTDSDAVGGDVPGSGITYQWYANGQLVHTAVDDNSYTPTEAEEGKALTVTASFTDAAGNPESGTSARLPRPWRAEPEQRSARDAQCRHRRSGAPLRPVTAVTDGGADVHTTVSYAWQVSDSADGHTGWTTVGSNASYTPTEANEGKTSSWS